MPKSRPAWIALFALALAVPAAAQTLDEVIAKNVETRGGLDALKAVTSAKVNGTMSMMGSEVPIRIEWKRPGKFRFEFEMQGMTGVMAYDGETGWGLMPMMGMPAPQPLPDDQLKQVRQQADLIDGDLVDYEEKGHAIELVGTEDVEGTEAYHLKITRADGDVVDTFLDTEYGLEFKQKAKMSIMGAMNNAEISIGDYKEVGSIVLAHSIEFNVPDMGFQQVISLNGVELNPEIDDARFVMPEPEEEAPPAQEPAGEEDGGDEKGEGGGV